MVRGQRCGRGGRAGAVPVCLALSILAACLAGAAGLHEGSPPHEQHEGTWIRWSLSDGQEVAQGELAAQFQVGGMGPWRECGGGKGDEGDEAECPGIHVAVSLNGVEAGDVPILRKDIPMEPPGDQDPRTRPLYAQTVRFGSMPVGACELRGRLVRGGVVQADSGTVRIVIVPAAQAHPDPQALEAFWGNAHALTPPWPLPCGPASSPNATSGASFSMVRTNVGCPALENFRERPVVVASWIKWLDALTFDEEELAKCAVPCTFLHLASLDVPQACIDQADLLLSTARGRPPALALKPAWQLWGYYSLESGATYTEMDDPAFMALFDLELSTRARAHVQMTFAPRDAHVIRRRAGGAKAGVLFLQGNCVPERDGYVRALMRARHVDALGACLKNGRYPDGVSTLEVVARFRYMLCIENSRYPDFVTERLFNAWIAGTIPLYLGAPNVAEYAPAPHSLIDLRDFPSPGDLAEYLDYLDGNETAREEYLKFKDPRTPLSRGFLRACERSMYARGGEEGSADPFPRVLMRDLAHPSLIAFTDKERCGLLNESLGIVDDAGIPVMHPFSKCFEGHSLKSRDHHRYNRLAACRICEAVREKQLSGLYTCPATPASVTLAMISPKTLRVTTTNFEEGSVILKIETGEAERRQLVHHRIFPTPIGSSGAMDLSVRGLPPGTFAFHALLASPSRRKLAEASLQFESSA